MQKAWGAVKGAVHDLNSALNADSDEEEQDEDQQNTTTRRPAGGEDYDNKPQPSSLLTLAFDSGDTVVDIVGTRIAGLRSGIQTAISALGQSVASSPSILPTAEGPSENPAPLPEDGHLNSGRQQQTFPQLIFSHQTSFQQVSPESFSALKHFAPQPLPDSVLGSNPDSTADAVDTNVPGAAATASCSTCLPDSGALSASALQGGSSVSPDPAAGAAVTKQQTLHQSSHDLPSLESGRSNESGDLASSAQRMALDTADRVMVDLVLEAAATLQRVMAETPLLGDEAVREAQAANVKWRSAEDTDSDDCQARLAASATAAGVPGGDLPEISGFNHSSSLECSPQSNENPSAAAFAESPSAITDFGLDSLAEDSTTAIDQALLAPPPLETAAVLAEFEPQPLLPDPHELLLEGHKTPEGGTEAGSCDDRDSESNSSGFLPTANVREERVPSFVSAANTALVGSTRSSARFSPLSAPAEAKMRMQQQPPEPGNDLNVSPPRSIVDLPAAVMTGESKAYWGPRRSTGMKSSASQAVDLWTGPDLVTAGVVTAWETFKDAWDKFGSVRGFEVLQAVTDRKPSTVTDLEPIAICVLNTMATVLPLLAQAEKTAQEVLPTLTQELGEARTKLGEAHDQIAALKEQHRLEVDSLQIANAQVRAEAAAAAAALEQQRQPTVAASARHVGAASSDGDLLTKVDELEDLNDDLQEQLEKWQEAHGALADKQRKLTAEVEQWQERCNNAEQVAVDVEVLRKQLAEQEPLVAQLPIVRERATLLERDNQVLQAELGNAQDVIAKLNSLISTLQTDTAGTSHIIERRLRTALAQLEAAEAQLLVSQGQVRQAEVLRKELGALRAKSETQQATVAKLTSENEVLNASITTLLQRLEALTLEKESLVDRNALQDAVKKYYELLSSQGMVSLLPSAKEEMLALLADLCGFDPAVRQICLGLSENTVRRLETTRSLIRLTSKDLQDGVAGASPADRNGVAVSPRSAGDTGVHIPRQPISTMFLDFLESEAAA